MQETYSEVSSCTTYHGLYITINLESVCILEEHGTNTTSSFQQCCQKLDYIFLLTGKHTNNLYATIDSEI